MLVDNNSVLVDGLPATAGSLGDTIDLGAAYNIGAGANRPPYVVITADGIVGAGEFELRGADITTADNGTKTSTMRTDVIMKMPTPATDDADVLFAGIMPAIPENAGNGLVVNCVTAPAGGNITIHITNNPPVDHIYPGK